MRMRTTLLLAAGLLLAGCAAPGKPTTGTGSGSTALDVRHLDGCASGETREHSEVVAGRAALQDLWNRSCGGGPAPDVDFAQRTVVAYFWGQKATSGYSVELLNATDDGGSVTVRVARDAPGPSCFNAQLITYPADVATIPMTAEAVTFATLDRTVPC